MTLPPFTAADKGCLVIVYMCDERVDEGFGGMGGGDVPYQLLSHILFPPPSTLTIAITL